MVMLKLLRTYSCHSPDRIFVRLENTIVQWRERGGAGRMTCVELLHLNLNFIKQTH